MDFASAGIATCITTDRSLAVCIRLSIVATSFSLWLTVENDMAYGVVPVNKLNVHAAIRCVECAIIHGVSMQSNLNNVLKACNLKPEAID